MKDWQVRALKTFTQSFIGVLIPELCGIFSGVLPTDWAGWETILIPILCSSISGGISAVWNLYQNGNN